MFANVFMSCVTPPFASLSPALMIPTLNDETNDEINDDINDETLDPFTIPSTPAWSLISLSDVPGDTRPLAEHPTLFMRDQMITLAVSTTSCDDDVFPEYGNRSMGCCFKYHVCS
jgi:hypothetical protein